MTLHESRKLRASVRKVRGLIKEYGDSLRTERDAALVEVERLKAAEKAVAEERGGERRQYRRSAEAYEKEAIRLKEAIKTAHADGASALIASFENVDPRARICELEAEVARLKEGTKLLPELTWKAERYREVCDVLKRPQGEDVVGMVESISKEWAELRAEKIVGTTISVEQAQEANRLGSQAAAVHTVRACARWLRENGWHNSVRDTAIEMERLMVEDVNRAYGTPDMCVPPNANVSKLEFDKLCSRVEALEQKLSPAVEWERRRIVAWIENQVDRYAGDTLRNDRERALVGNVLRMLAMQIRDGEHHDVSL